MKKRYKVVIFIAILILLVGSVILISHLAAPKIAIAIDSDGRLYIKTDIDTESMYIYWETDAGNIKPSVANDDLKYQPDNAYFCYTAADETALWDIGDYDGCDYSGATIKAYLYKPAWNDTIYNAEKTIGNSEITIEKVGSNIQTADKRIFGNPVRADDQTKWSQIILYYDLGHSMVILRYRTGADIGKNDIIQWESKLPLLCRYEFNGLPFDSIKSPEGSNIIRKDNLIILYFNDYNAYTQISDENYNYETNETEITVRAFIYDKKSKTEKYECRIVYSYNDAKREYKKLD